MAVSRKSRLIEFPNWKVLRAEKMKMGILEYSQLDSGGTYLTWVFTKDVFSCEQNKLIFRDNLKDFD